MGTLLEETERLSPATAMRVLEPRSRKIDLLKLDGLALDPSPSFIDNQVRVGAVIQTDGFAHWRAIRRHSRVCSPSSSSNQTLARQPTLLT